MHVEQDVFPESVGSVYVSAPQSLQAIACKSALNLPAAQGVQAAAELAAAVKVPWVHSVQLVGPLAPGKVAPKYPAEHCQVQT